MKIGVKEYSEEPAPLSSKLRHVLEGIPSEYNATFRAYMVKVSSNQLTRMMWISLTNGHRIMQLDKDMHIFVTGKFLRSRDYGKVQEAVEAMRRTLGSWEARG